MDALMLDRAENTVTVPENFLSTSTSRGISLNANDLSEISSHGFLTYVVAVLSQAGRLTEIRARVLELALLGRQYAEIAQILGKSPNTVASQVKAILDALGADSTRDLFRVFLTEVDRIQKLPAPGLLSRSARLESA